MLWGENYKMISNNLYKKFRKLFWHNIFMELLERYVSKFNSYLWRSRWGDRSLYQSDQKKRHPD